MFTLLKNLAIVSIHLVCLLIIGRRGGLMVSALDSGSGGSGSSPGHCVVFLGKILYSHSASLHPDGFNGYWRIYCWG